MEIQAAITQVHNANVAVVWVNRYAIVNDREAAAYTRQLEARFAMPVVLAANGRDRTPLFFSPHEDLVASLSLMPLLSLPWSRYEVA
jgi:hypothetical protein